MAKGENQQGKRRGSYEKLHVETVANWSPEDCALFDRLLAAANLEHEVTSERLARRAVEADRLCQRLDALPDRTGDQDRALASAHVQFRANVAALGADKAKAKVSSFRRM